MAERTFGRTTVDKLTLVPFLIVAAILLVVVSEALHLSGALGAKETWWELLEITALLVLGPAMGVYAIRRTIRLRHEIASRKQAVATARMSEATSRALRENDQRYRALFDRSLDAVYIHDLEGNFLDANDATLRMLGYTRAEIPTLAFANLLDESQLPTALATLQELMTTGSQAEMTAFRLRRKDGSVVDVETLASIITKDGQAIAIQGIARDITARRRAEAGLRTANKELESRVAERTAELEQRNAELRQEVAMRKHTEETLRLHGEIMQNMAEAVYLIRASDGIIVYTNPAFERLFGYGAGEMSGKRVSIVNAPTGNSPDDTAREIIATLERTGAWSGEILNVKKDGTRFWCYANVSKFVHDEHGEVWVSYHTDITERKQAEEELRASEERFRHLYTATPAMLHSIDTEGRIVNVSDYWLEVLGYDRSEVIGRKSVEFLTEESRRYAGEVALPEFWKRGVARDVGYQFVRKDGEIVDVLLSAIAERDKDGSPYSTLAVLTDITEQKCLEEQLQRAREALEGKVERQMLRKNPYGLTFREFTVLHLVAVGRSNKEIAAELVISPQTAHKHVANILAKMDAASRTEAATRALREGLIE